MPEICCFCDKEIKGRYVHVRYGEFPNYDGVEDFHVKQTLWFHEDCYDDTH